MELLRTDGDGTGGHHFEAGRQLLKPGSAGKPVLNVETRLMDDDGKFVPVGTVGEIVHRSGHVMTGYLNDAEKTADAFQFGWFHSGDLGRFDEDGYLYVVDRKKDMIKTGGEKCGVARSRGSSLSLSGC